MSLVIKITDEQASQLQGVECYEGVFFAPNQNDNGDWFVTTQEQEQCSIDWLKAIEPTVLNPVNPSDYIEWLQQLNEIPKEDSQPIFDFLADKTKELDLDLP